MWAIAEEINACPKTLLVSKFRFGEQVMRLSKLELLSILGLTIGLTSIFFMAYVFYNESVLGRGVLYIEPNRTLAGLELAFTIFGLLVQGFITLAFVLNAKITSAKNNSDDDPDVMPQASLDREPDAGLWT